MPYAEVRVDLRDFEAGMTDIEKRQLPYALAWALNETVRTGRLEVQKQMETYFDRPTPYAKRGVVYDRASKNSLVAAVALTGDRTRGGLPATAFLGPQVHGGLRSLKAFERQLVERGMMVVGEVAVPAARTKLNRYGNMSQGFLNRVMADLQVDYRGAGATRVRTDQSLKRNKNYRAARFFAAKRGSHLAPGIYQRDPRGRTVFPVILFVKQKAYAKRLPFDRIVADHVAATFNANFVAGFARISERFAARR